MTSSPAGLLGRPLLGIQSPRLRSLPGPLSDAGIEVLELAESAGMNLDPWQQGVLLGGFSERPGGQLSAFEVAMIVGRQNGKGTILEAAELAWLFLTSDRVVIHTAHEFKTAVDAFDRLVGWIDANDWMRRKVLRIRTSHGDESVELRDGCRVRFMARTKGSGRGFAADKVVFDEAFALTAQQVGALLPTLSARRNPQLWYASSGPLESSDSLRAVRERGIRGGDPGLAFFEWSADPRSDIDDRDAWAAANPALGLRLTEEFIERERAAMTEVEFARERLGIPDEARTAGVLGLDVWVSLIDRASQPGEGLSFAVDVNPDRSAAAIAMVSRRDDGRWHVEIVDSRHGTAWVVDRVVELYRRWAPPPILLDPSGPVGSLLPALSEARVPTVSVTGRQLAQACGGFYDAAVEDRLRHLDDVGLTAAIGAVRRRPVGDAWVWHRRDFTDVSPLWAATLAMFGAAQQAGRGRRTSTGRIITLA